jgi:hypothetical protein
MSGTGLDVAIAGMVACMDEIDLDPCSNSVEIPNVPAARHYTIGNNGLVQPREGRIFINPPFPFTGLTQAFHSYPT